MDNANADQSSDDLRPPFSRRDDYICAGILFACSFSSVSFHGFSFGFNNNVFHIPIVLDYYTSPEGPHDAFHSTLSSFVSGLWPAMAWWIDETNILQAFLWLHVATRWAFFVTIYALSRLAGATPTVAGLSIGVIAFSSSYLTASPLGHNEIAAPYFTHSVVVIPVIMLTWFCLITRNWILVGFFLGLAFNINAFTAIWAGLTAVAVLARICVLESRRSFFASFSRIGLTGAILAAPTALWIMSTITSAAPVDYDFGTYLNEYYDKHTYFFRYLTAAPEFLAIWCAGCLILHGTERHGPRHIYIVFSTLYLAYGCVLLLAIVLPYLTTDRRALTLFPLRMDTYVIVLTFLATVCWLSNSFKKGAWELPLVALLALINANNILLLAAVSFHALEGTCKNTLKLAVAATVFIIFGALVATQGTGILVGSPNFMMANLAAWLFQAMAIGFVAARPRPFRGPEVVSLIAFAWFGPLQMNGGTAALVFAAASCGLAASAILISDCAILWRRYCLVVLGGLALVASYVANPALSVFLFLGIAQIIGFIWLNQKYEFIQVLTFRAPVPVMFTFMIAGFILASWTVYTRPLGILDLSREDVSWIEVQNWARTHTRPDTMFLVPEGREGFSVFSRRPVWVDWKSGAAAMWSPWYYYTWSKRIKEVNTLNGITQRVEYARAHGIPFVVINASGAAESVGALSDVVFRNSFFLVLAVQH